MIARILVVGFVVSSLAQPALSFADKLTIDVPQQEPTLSDIQAYAVASPTADDSKREALRQNGIMSGMQGGMIKRGREIYDELMTRHRELDRAFGFSVLVSRQGYLPPVIEQVNQKVETKNEAQRIEYAGVIYKVTRLARFVRVAPTWRDYLITGLVDKRLKVDPLPEAIRPKKPEEKKVWADAVQVGWLRGEAQADAIFSENLARMKRDYVGMLRYQYLLSKGMIKTPVLAETPDGVHVSDSEIAIDTGEKVIQVPARMDKDFEHWGGKDGN